MGLSLKEVQTANELAECLYPFLPGKPHPHANQDLSFPGVAAKLGLHQYWPSGSKRPAIAHLLVNTLEHRRSRFCPLILSVVQNSMIYRARKAPVTRTEIDRANELILRIGFKIPELHDHDFLDGLASGQEDERGEPTDKAKLQSVSKALIVLQKLPPSERGFEFEQLLTGCGKTGGASFALLLFVILCSAWRVGVWHARLG